MSPQTENLHLLLEKLHARSIHEKGLAFERLCRWFLANDPAYRLQIKRVWLFGEWPERWGGDTGTDLIAETQDGKIWAIQAKAHSPHVSVTKRMIDSFLSDTNRPGIDYRLLIATTNNIAPNALKTMNAQAIPVGVLRLSDLKKSEVAWPDSLETLKSVKREPKKPREHQREAIQKTLKGFESHKRGQVIMACGSGKTLTSLWISEALKAQRTLVLLPSLSLLSQTLTEWAANCSEPFSFLPVCSDGTVGDRDQMASSISELGFPATTEASEIQAFLKGDGRRVVFSTYQSAKQIAEAFKQSDIEPFNLAIADEAHRCAGKVSAHFGTILDEDAVPCERRLFTTATPRIFTGRMKKIAGESENEIASMDDEAVFGPVFHKLNFSEAIEKDLLSDYQVVVIGVDDAMCREYLANRQIVTVADGEVETDAATLAAHVAIAKAMQRYNLRRVISFHSRVNTARKFSENLPKVVKWMPEHLQPSGILWTSHVSGKMPTGKRDALLDRFRELEDGERGLMSNARCLSEGVDVPALDGVAFVDPRRSQVDIVQALGRVMRKVAGKEKGTIIIPVFLDESDNPERVLEGSKFKPVWEVCQSLKMHDDVLSESLDLCRRKLGKGSSIGSNSFTKLSFDFPDSVGPGFAEKIRLEIVNVTTHSWQFWLGLLEEHLMSRGPYIPADKATLVGGKAYNLGSWCAKQRVFFRKGKLSKERVADLNTLGFCWEPYEEKFTLGIKAFLQYQNRENSPLVPVAHEEIIDGYRFPLGNWCHSRRQLRKRGKESEANIERLDAIGFAWDHKKHLFWANFAAWRQFINREGHRTIPKGHLEDRDGSAYDILGWQSRVRNQWRKGTLSTNQISALEAGSFLFDPNSLWFESFTIAYQQFVAINGHSRVSSSVVEKIGGHTVNLGKLVQLYRSKWRRGKLGTEQIKKLESINFEWEPASQEWYPLQVAALRQFIEREGDARVRRNHVEVLNGSDVKLGSWVTTIRGLKRANKLDQERQGFLDELGFIWDGRKGMSRDRWRSTFDVVFQYAQEHNGLPNSEIEVRGVRIVQTVRSWRSGFIEFSDERRSAIETIPGWSRDTDKDQEWERRFAVLEDFARIYGNARPKVGDVHKGQKVGRWVFIQRQARKKGWKSLGKNKIERLERLPEWAWSVREAQWEEGLSRLQKYTEINGTADPPTGYQDEDGFNLDSWANSRRLDFKKATLTKERIMSLESLQGWSWKPNSDQRFEEGYESLKAFVSEHGHARPAFDQAIEGFKIGRWVARLRQAKREEWKSLTPERQTLLESLPGWVWKAI
jgi:superfamily II DNA or RNA helicase